MVFAFSPVPNICPYTMSLKNKNIKSNEQKHFVLLANAEGSQPNTNHLQVPEHRDKPSMQISLFFSISKSLNLNPLYKIVPV